MLGSMGVADRGMGYVDLLLMQYWSPRSPEICPCCFFLGGGEMLTNFGTTLGADFGPCIKLGVLSPPRFQVGGARAPTAPPAPTSLIWCVVRDPLAMRLTLLRGGVHLHVRTCTPLFRFSGTAGRIALKFGMLLETS